MIKYLNIIGDCNTLESFIIEDIEIRKGFLLGLKEIKTKYTEYDEIEDNLFKSILFKNAIKETKGTVNPDKINQKLEEFFNYFK